MVLDATWLAGLSFSGVKIWQRKPRRAAARADIRPNCPPHKIPIVAPGDNGILFFSITGHHLGYRRQNLFVSSAIGPAAWLFLHLQWIE